MKIMKSFVIILMSAALLIGASLADASEIYWGGFIEGLWAGGLNDKNPTNRDFPASEARLQLRLESFGDNAEAFGKIDFVQDGFDSANYSLDVREAYLKFRLPIDMDFKIGRQILTWGTGDLIFINDVFAKDYQSFFIGRQDQYLKAPQTALRTEWFTSLGSLSVVLIPIYESNILPTGRRLSFYNPMQGKIVGADADFEAVKPSKSFENVELAFRYAKPISGFTLAGYAYRGFYKDPKGYDAVSMKGFFPKLNVYGASLRGMIQGGVLWIEGGYYDSRQERNGDQFFVENSSAKGLIGYERQLFKDFTANVQFYAEYMMDHGKYVKSYSDLVSGGNVPPGMPLAEETRTLLTTRLRQQLLSQTVTLSAFVFYSPTDSDGYARFSIDYKYTDELSLMLGGNIFAGRDIHTQFGQFDLNDNLYVKVNYGF